MSLIVGFIKDYKCQSEFFGGAYATCRQRIVLDNGENAFGNIVALRLVYIRRCVFNTEKNDLLLEILSDVRAVATLSQGQHSGRTGRKLQNCSVRPVGSGPRPLATCRAWRHGCRPIPSNKDRWWCATTKPCSTTGSNRTGLKLSKVSGTTPPSGHGFTIMNGSTGDRRLPLESNIENGCIAILSDDLIRRGLSYLRHKPDRSSERTCRA